MKMDADIVAVNWREKAILLGEAEWGGHPVAKAVVCELVQKSRLVVPGKAEDWDVSYALFARAGFTSAAQADAARHDALLADLPTLDRDLA